MPAKILYTVSCQTPHTHHFHVEMTIREVGSGPIRIAMPVWTPGAYQVHDYAGSVHGVEFQDERGRPLHGRKVDKTTWEVRPGRSGTVLATYESFGLDVSVDKCYLDQDRATVNGAGVYMYVDGRKDEVHQVTFRVPSSWKKISTGLRPVSRPPCTYEAGSYDELVDCPVMMGTHRVETFRVRGVPHHVAIVGQGNYDLKVLLSDMRKIVEQAIAVFDDVPYSDYTFFMEMAPEGGGGLEHLNSTHMIFPRYGFKPRKDYTQALGLISHEFFHTWNVKRLRPRPLGPFDYSREVYTQLLWFAEGFTSYYDLLLLRRGGSISAREYLDEMGREIRRLSLLPGRLVQSLEESSFDAWVKLYRQTPDSPNTTISYYNKGCLFGMALDLSIQHETRGRKNLDDVMRLLYKRHYRKSNEGITGEDIEAACQEVVGHALTPLFDRIVREKRDVDWERYLALAGLEIASKQKPPPPGKVKPGDETTRSYLGIRLKSGPCPIVSVALAGGAACEAGVAPGDELIALDGNRLDESKLDKCLGQLPPGTPVRLTIARSGMLRDVELELGDRPLVEFSIQPRRRATTREKELCRAWLREPWNKIDRPEKGLDFRPKEKIY